MFSSNSPCAVPEQWSSLFPHVPVTLDAQSCVPSPLPGGTGECLDAESLLISGFFFFFVRAPLLSHPDYICLGMCLPHLVMECSGELARGRELV